MRSVLEYASPAQRDDVSSSSASSSTRGCVAVAHVGRSSRARIRAPAYDQGKGRRQWESWTCAPPARSWSLTHQGSSCAEHDPRVIEFPRGPHRVPTPRPSEAGDKKILLSLLVVVSVLVYISLGHTGEGTAAGPPGSATRGAFVGRGSTACIPQRNTRHV